MCAGSAAPWLQAAFARYDRICATLTRHFTLREKKVAPEVMSGLAVEESRSCLRSVAYLGFIQVFQGRGIESGSLVGSRGKSPVGGLQKLKLFCEWVH